MGKAAELGSSLLASKQRRDDKYNKEQESYEKRQALFSLIVPPLVKEASSWIQKDNIRSFDKNESLIKENRDSSMAYAAAQNWMTIDKEVQEQGGSAFNYYANLNRPEAERRAAEAMRTADMNIYVGKHGPYQQQITELVDGWAQTQADTYEEAMGHLRKIGTPAEYESIVALARSDARSDDIFGTLFQKAKNYVTGTTKEEVDNRAIQAIANSPLARNVDLFNVFQAEYKENGDVMKAHDFTLVASGLKITDKDTENQILWTVSDRDVQVQVVDKVLTYRGSETHTALNDPAVTFIKDLDKNTINFETYENPEMSERFARDMAREVYDNANFHTLAFANLNTKGFATFTGAVEDKIGLDMISLEASDDIALHLPVVGEIYQQISKNPAYLRNEIIEGGAKAMFSTVVSDMQELFVTLADFAKIRDQGPVAEEAYKNELARIQSISGLKIQSIEDAIANLQDAGVFKFESTRTP
tara:strand:- start:8816 stop:10237 length:1422 start_codon:yes stop_codon:yes gene_type:complete